MNNREQNGYYEEGIRDIFKEFRTSNSGLSDAEAKKRLEERGFNRIKEEKKISKLHIFLSQFKGFVIWILIAATVISFFIGESIDAMVILVIVVLNGVFGFIQEFKAEKSIEALKRLTALKTVVIRNGKEKEIVSDEVVPGDIIVIDTGVKIPADSRLIEAVDLEIQESSLTGESVPVLKQIASLKGGLAINDQKNMVFSSTIVTRGNGKAVVVATGMNSEIGKIAGMIQRVEEESTPLQKKLDVLGRKLGIATIIIAALIFVLEFLFPPVYSDRRER